MLIGQAPPDFCYFPNHCSNVRCNRFTWPWKVKIVKLLIKRLDKLICFPPNLALCIIDCFVVVVICIRQEL